MNYSKGFTLIELMIVVIVVGILAAIAIPSYNEYYRRKDRSIAQQEMLKVAAELERVRSKNFSYDGANADVANLYQGTNARYASGNFHVPVDRETDKQNYRIEITIVDGGFGWRILGMRKDPAKQAQNYDLYLDSKGLRCMARANIDSRTAGCGANAEVW